MIHGAMGAGHGRCAVANRMESAPTHWVRLSEARSVSGGGLRKKFMGCHQFCTIPTASAVARLFHTAYDSPQCHLGYKPDADNSELSSNHEPSTQVYAVHGADPEVQAYGMAKYSRSALSMRESLAEINDQKAEKFLNTFYFQYGHRSIADLAHIAFAIERLSILAATVAVDEPRWDGQERSTRYQDFQKSGYYVPDFGDDAAASVLYRDTVDHLFAEYRHFSEEMFGYLRERTPKPAEMKQEAYERTLRARAFDLSRYLLPLATNTSLGQIVSARTLENQVSRLLSHTHAEVRHLGELLRRAAQEPAYDVSHAKAWALLDEIARESPAMAGRAGEFLMRPIRVAPTLMKYAEPNAYEMETRRELEAAAQELLAGVAIRASPDGRFARRRSAGGRARGHAAVSVFASPVSADSRVS